MRIGIVDGRSGLPASTRPGEGGERILVGQAALGNFHDVFAPDNRPAEDLKSIYLQILTPRAVMWCAINGYDYALLNQIVKDSGVALHLTGAEWNTITSDKTDKRRAYVIHFAGAQQKKPRRIRKDLRRY